MATVDRNTLRAITDSLSIHAATQPCLENRPQVVQIGAGGTVRQGFAPDIDKS